MSKFEYLKLADTVAAEIANGALKPGDRSAGVFGTALTIDDAIAELLGWRHQLIGKAKEGAVPCTVIESSAALAAA